MLPSLLLPALLAAPPALPPLFPADVPLPPAAKVVQVVDHSGARAGSQSIVVSFRTGLKAADVLDFYRRLFQGRGRDIQDLGASAPILSAVVGEVRCTVTVMEALGTVMLSVQPAGGTFAAHSQAAPQAPPRVVLKLDVADGTRWALSGAAFPGNHEPGALLVRRDDGSLWGLGLGLVQPREGTGAGGHRYCRQEDAPRIPVKLAEGVRFAVAAPGGPMGAFYVVDATGTLRSSGSDSGGRLGQGIGDATFRWFEPAPVLEDVRFVAASNANTAAITSRGELFVWGSNLSKQVPGCAEGFAKRPVKVLEGVVHVALSREAVYAVKADGTLWGWGEAYENGFLDGGVVRRREAPIRIMEGVKAVYTTDIAPVLALKAEGSLWTWGSNSQGQCGQGSQGLAARPARIAEGVEKVALDSHHAALLKTDGTVWTWGWNWAAQCGFPSAERNLLKPRKLAEGAVDIAVTSGETYVLKRDGSLWGAGHNSEGVARQGGGLRQAGAVKVELGK